MATNETYWYGQGKVKVARIENGKQGAWRWVGDVSELSLALEIEKVEHKESYSGQKALVRSFPIAKTCTLSATLQSIDPQNLALTLFGKIVNQAAATKDIERKVTVGEELILDDIGISKVKVTDKDGAALDAKTYELDTTYGILTFNTVPDNDKQPLKIHYQHAATSSVPLFSASQPTLALRYEGINLAEGGAPVVVELYKVATDPLKELAFITDGNSLGGMQISGGVLIDTSKSAIGDLGQFGRIVQLVA